MPPTAETPFLKYPRPVEIKDSRETEYKHAIAYTPTLTGLGLNIYCRIVTSFRIIQSIIYYVGRLGDPSKLERKGVLKSLVPCFDPTVVPLPPSKETASSSVQTVYDPFSSYDAPYLRTDSVSPFYSASDYVAAYKSGKTTPTKVIEKILDVLSTDPFKAHIFCSLASRETILAQAAASTERYKMGTPLPLDGVPLAVKDELDVEGFTTTLGLSTEQAARRLKDGPLTYTSFCVQRLLDTGMILLGKTIMPELGLDTSGDNPHWGTPLNPHNPKYYCGGSSAGSSASVAAGLSPIAVGADGGGSIRIPASYTGIWGIKPSHGRVSSFPSPCFAPSVVAVGPLAATINDLEIGYRIMATPNQGHDSILSSSALFTPPGTIPITSQKVLGIYTPWLDSCPPQVRSIFDSSVKLLKTKGYQVINITLPYLNDNLAAHRLIIMSDLGSMITSVGANIAGLTPFTQVLASVASRATSHDYISANRLRTQIMEHLSYLYTTHPGLIILTPTTPCVGLKIPLGTGHKGSYGLCDANHAIESMVYVFLANLTGCPAISMPCGYVEVSNADGRETTKDEMPVGLMGMSEWGSEDLLLRLGKDWDDAWGSNIKRGKGWVDVLV